MIKNYPCPICNGYGARIIHSELRKLVTYYYSICKNCGFVFQNLRYNREHYEKLPYQSPENYAEHAKNRADYIYDFIEDYIPEPKTNLLDIGAGKGGVLYYLQKKIKNIETATGYTLHEDKPISKKLGMIYKNFEDYHKADFHFDKKYNVVIMSHIVEHFYNLKIALKNIRQVTDENALIYVEVPNFYWCEVRSPSVFTPEHLSYFTPTSLLNLFQQNGFAAINAKASKHWGNLKVVFRKKTFPIGKLQKENHFLVQAKYNFNKLLFPVHRARKAGPND